MLTCFGFPESENFSALKRKKIHFRKQLKLLQSGGNNYGFQRLLLLQIYPRWREHEQEQSLPLTLFENVSNSEQEPTTHDPTPTSAPSRNNLCHILSGDAHVRPRQYSPPTYSTMHFFLSLSLASVHTHTHSHTLSLSLSLSFTYSHSLPSHSGPFVVSIFTHLTVISLFLSFF